jgi:zinc protease
LIYGIRISMRKAEFKTQIKKNRQHPVSEEDLKIATALYNGSFALNMENPDVTAVYARNVLINKLPKDYYSTYLQKSNAVTIADIQVGENKYFMDDKMRIIVIGQTAQFNKQLKQMGLKVKEYTTVARPISETN